MKQITLIIVIFLVLGVVGISGCTNSDDTSTNTQTSNVNTSNTVKAADYPICPLCGAVCNKDLVSGVKASEKLGMCPNCDIVVDAPQNIPNSPVVCAKCNSGNLQTFNKWNEPTKYKCMNCDNIGWLDDIEN